MFKLDMAALRKAANSELCAAANDANAANFSHASDVRSDKLARLAGLAGSGDSENDSAQAVEPADKPSASNLAEAIPDPDRWCWPHSAAMTGREIDVMVERTALFYRRGLTALESELLADTLVNRDRQADDRRLCLECAHLSGRAGAGRCSQWQQAGLGEAALPAGLAVLMQRCDGFKSAGLG